MEFVDNHKKERIEKLDNTLELYEKLRNKEELKLEEYKCISFDVGKNEFKVNDMSYKDTRSERMRLQEWESLLEDINFKVYIMFYKCDYNEDFIVCGKDRNEEDFIHWSVEIDTCIYKEEKERGFKIGIEAKGSHRKFEELSEKNDKCFIKFYIGELETSEIVRCKGYDLDEEDDTVIIVEKLCKCVKDEDLDDYPTYFCKYKKVTELGKKILKTVIKKYIGIIIHNASFYEENN